MNKNCAHDMRFKGVYGARLGCLACELEDTEAKRKKLEDELESTADKLSDVWLHLDSWARGELLSLDGIRQACASILRHQKAPGWKDGE